MRLAFLLLFDIMFHISYYKFIASRPTVIMFHGNGGNLGHRVPLANIFVMKMRCNVLMMCYRGCVCSCR